MGKWGVAGSRQFCGIINVQHAKNAVHAAAAVDILHFNARYPDSLGEDATTTLRASDHDPLEGRFWFRRWWPRPCPWYAED